jgi:hypothetical protein|tara:strand:- start:571 stop:684 length:114 start_codon:yes stop_codon:yes gene_type:complete
LEQLQWLLSHLALVQPQIAVALTVHAAVVLNQASKAN